MPPAQSTSGAIGTQPEYPGWQVGSGGATAGGEAVGGPIGGWLDGDRVGVAGFGDAGAVDAGREELELGDDVGLVELADGDGPGAGSWSRLDTNMPTQQSATRPLATATIAAVMEKNGRFGAGAGAGAGRQREPSQIQRRSGDSGSHRAPFHRYLPSGEI